MAGCEVEKEWVSVSEAAVMLGVSRNTVKRMIAAGSLEWRRITEPRGWLLIKVASIRAPQGSSDVSDDPSGDTGDTEEDPR